MGKVIDISLFSKNSKVLSFFKKIRNSKAFSLVIYNPVNYKTILRNTIQQTFVYVDISSFEKTEREKLINYITHQKRFDFGLIDPKNSISDPAALFYHGASDYLGKDTLKQEAKTNRIKNAVDFYSVESIEDESSEIPFFEDIMYFSDSFWLFNKFF